MKDVISELVIGFDRKGYNANTIQICTDWCVDNKVPGEFFDIDSPTDIGFDAARNAVIAKAEGDWILWLDSDEELIRPKNLLKFLRNNQYNGYAISQNHFSGDPAGIVKTDMPVKVFRNGKGIRFYGVVHEHPEVELNKGVGHVQLLGDVKISHHGYVDEAVRRDRFERNIGLLIRDRQQYPDRMIGKFLWLRDLAQMCMYEMEQNGKMLTKAMKERVPEGKKLWRELIAGGQLRMAIDAMEYYSLLSQLGGDCFEFAFTAKGDKLAHADLTKAKTIVGVFNSRDDVDLLVKAITDEELRGFDSRYY